MTMDEQGHSGHLKAQLVLILRLGESDNIKEMNAIGRDPVSFEKV